MQSVKAKDAKNSLQPFHRNNTYLYLLPGIEENESTEELSWMGLKMSAEELTEGIYVPLQKYFSKSKNNVESNNPCVVKHMYLFAEL